MESFDYTPPEDRLDERAEILAALMSSRARRWRRRMARRLAAAGPEWVDAVPSGEEWGELVESLRPHLDVSARAGRESVLAALRAEGVEVDEWMLTGSEAAAAAAVGAIMVGIAGTGPRVAERVAAAIAEARVDGSTPSDVVRKLGLRGVHPGPISDDLARDWGSTVGRAAVYAGIDSVISRLEGEKTWRCMFVNSRETHIEAHDQRVPLSEPFLIGGYPGRYPHDPLLPVQEVISCQCGVDYKVAAVAALAPVAAPSAVPEQIPVAASVEREDVVLSLSEMGVTSVTRQGVTVTFAADAEQRSSGIMVSVEPTDDERAAIVAAVGPDALPAEELHVTLAYFGSVDDVPPDEVELRRGGIREAMGRVAEACGPVAGEITGLSTLGDDDPPAQVGLVDAVGLGSLRAMLSEQVAEFCPLGWMRRDHDFLAHVTVAYRAEGAPAEIVGLPLSFGRLYLHWGDEVEEVELRGDGGGEAIPGPRSGEVAVVDSTAMTVTDTSDPIAGLLSLVPDDVADDVRAEIVESLAAHGVSLEVVETPDAEDAPGVEEGDEVEAPDMPAVMEWQGPLTVEGRVSGDRRVIAPGALTWRDFPLPMMLQKVNEPAHLRSEFAGNIWRIERRDDGTVWGWGTYDDSPAGEEARRLVDGNKMRGVSVDMDRAEAVVVQLADLANAGLSLSEGDDPSWAVELYPSARIMGVTITPFPAFQEAYIEPVGPGSVLDAAGIKVAVKVKVCEGDEEDEMEEPGEVEEPEEEPMVASGGVPFDGARIRAHLSASWTAADDSSGLALVASAAHADTDAAPRACFEERPMERPEYMSIAEDGSVWGLVCDWETAHIGLPGRYVTAPRDPNFDVFYGTRTYTTAEGDRIRCGPVVMDTVHPSLKLRASDAQAFYAHTGSVVMAVRLYANKWGIAAAGTLLPGVSRDQVTRLGLADFSPDWRPVGRRGVTVCAVLAVPLSGFPAGAIAASGGAAFESLTPRAAFDAHGNLTAMVAVGAVRRHVGRSTEERLDRVEAELRRPRVEAALAVLGVDTPEEARKKRVAAAAAVLNI